MSPQPLIAHAVLILHAVAKFSMVSMTAAHDRMVQILYGDRVEVIIL